MRGRNRVPSCAFRSAKSGRDDMRSSWPLVPGLSAPRLLHAGRIAGFAVVRHHAVMRPLLLLSLALATFTLAQAASTAAGTAPASDTMASLQFINADYLHRWSNADQHEFTPRDQ